MSERPQSPLEAFGRRLREAMATRRVSNTAVARELGVHAITVSKWRGGTQPIEPHRIPALATFLGVSEDWLREGGSPIARAMGVAESEPPPFARHARNLPHSVRQYLGELRLRLIKAGASDDQIDEALDLMKSPAVFGFFIEGATKEFTESDVLANVKTFVEESILPTLRRRGLKL